MAIRDFYTEHYTDTLVSRVDSMTDALSPTSLVSGIGIGSPDISVNTRKLPLVLSADDRWALEYISIPRMQPLLEAIDDDASSFVTITEINNFTQARPGYWRSVAISD